MINKEVIKSLLRGSKRATGRAIDQNFVYLRRKAPNLDNFRQIPHLN